MSKPTVGSSSVPVFHIGRNMDNRTRQNLYRRFTFFLIPASTGYTDKHLSATFRCTVNMPVIAATWFKSNVRDIHLLARNRSKITVTNKILCIGCIGFANRENHLTLESCFGILTNNIFRPYSFCQIERCPRFRPTCIETYMSDNLCDLRAGDAVLLRRLKMINERIVRDSHTDKGGNGY